MVELKQKGIVVPSEESKKTWSWKGDFKFLMFPRKLSFEVMSNRFSYEHLKNIFCGLAGFRSIDKNDFETLASLRLGGFRGALVDQHDEPLLSKIHLRRPLHCREAFWPQNKIYERSE